MKIGGFVVSRKIFAFGISALGVLMLAAVAIIASLRGEADAQVSVSSVVRGPLTISVSERGTIKARQQEIIKCLVEGQTTIIFLVDEGVAVKKGDLLIELDSSKLQDTKVNQQILVQNAEANFIRARENLEVVKNQAIADVAKAQLDAQFAKEDLRNYDDGSYPNEVRTAENKITIANEEVQRAAEKLRWTEVLYGEKYVSQTELQADRLSQKKTQLDLELAQDSLRLLKEYSYKRKVDEMKSTVEQTTMALERAKRKALADLAQAEADLKAKESEFQRQTSQLAKTTKQIGSCQMFAPTNGLVVYATTGQGGFRQQEPLNEGVTVRERQDLIYLPTATDMMAEVKIHESNLSKITVGLPVAIVIDALPGQSFMGRVSRIAPLPDGASMWMNPDLKVYNTEIVLNGDGSALKTGMSCMAQIIVESHQDAIHVPIQAIVRENGQPMAYVLKNGKVEPRKVTLGLDNNNRVHIIAGLLQDEQVLTTPPINGSAEATAPSAFNAEQTPTTLPARPPLVVKSDKSGADVATTAPAANANLANGSTPESRERARQRLESMTPEEKAQFEVRRGQRRGGAGGGNGAGNGAAGAAQGRQ